MSRRRGQSSFGTTTIITWVECSRSDAARPGWIVQPQYVAGQQEARLQPRPKAQALMHLIESAFNFNVHGAAGFERLAQLVDASACHSFSYSRLDAAVAVFEALAAEARGG